MELAQIKNIIEAVLLTADHPMDLRKLEAIFEADEENRPGRDQILQALQQLQEDYQGRGVELKEVASGYRMQVVPDCADWVSRMWEEKAPRYSRALLETLVLIAYRQPITRGEIEEIRGVSVSSHIVKTLSEREWVRVLGHKDVPGKPSMYGTTREFLDYFNLKSLDDLPSLAELKDLDKLHPELAFDQDVDADAANDSGDEKSTGETALKTGETDVQAESADMATEEQPVADAGADAGVQGGDQAGDETRDGLDPENDETSTDTLDEASQHAEDAEDTDEQPLNEQDAAERASEEQYDDQSSGDQSHAEEVK